MSMDITVLKQLILISAEDAGSVTRSVRIWLLKFIEKTRRGISTGESQKSEIPQSAIQQVFGTGRR